MLLNDEFECGLKAGIGGIAAVGVWDGTIFGLCSVPSSPTTPFCFDLFFLRLENSLVGLSLNCIFIYLVLHFDQQEIRRGFYV